MAAVGCLLAVTAVAAPTYFVNRGFATDIAFARLERQGLEYLRPLQDLQENLGWHRILSRIQLRGGAVQAAQLREAEERIDKGFSALRDANARVGESLQFTPEGLSRRQRGHVRVETMRGEWETLRKSWTNMSAAAADRAHAHLSDDIRTSIKHAGDTSNLILDSDLDSFYLMDAVVVALPQTQDRLADIAAMSEDAVGGAGLRDALIATAPMLKESDLDHTLDDLHTALNEDANFHGTSESLQANLPKVSGPYESANKELLDLMNRAAAEPALAAQGALESHAWKAREASSRLWKTSAAELDNLLAKREQDISTGRWLALGLCFIALVSGASVAAAVLRKATRLLRKAAFRIRKQSAAIAGVSVDIVEASQSVANGARQQAASLEETMASSEEIGASAMQSRSHVREAADLMSRSQGLVEEANRRLSEMEGAIGRITESSRLVSKIVKTIDEVAFQTNILSLNAAVEAARAGEAGTGFAVVADEVRSLAQRCSHAAKDTADLVEQSIVFSSEGQEKVESAAASIRALTGTFVEIKGLVEAVHEGSNRQNFSIEEIVTALTAIGQVTQRNAVSAEKAAQAAEELRGRSQPLTEVVGELVALAGGRPVEQHVAA